MACHDKQSDDLVFFVNGKKVIERQADPEELLLYYLRKELRLSGTKYGCGVGGCGACTVMLSTYDPVARKIRYLTPQFSFTPQRHHPANSCLLPICSLHGAAVTTVEGVGSIKNRINPIQERLAKCHGSQCGFCTPGMVMSIYALLRNHVKPSMEQIISALDGNLCRCTGYRPIIDSYASFAKEQTYCQLRGSGQCCLDQEELGCSSAGVRIRSGLCNPAEFLPVDPTQEFIFPPELMRMAREQQGKTLIFCSKRTTWISPSSLKELLELKAKYPKAPLVVGNTSLGLNKNDCDAYHPIVLHPLRIPEMQVVSITDDGIVIGAACCLAQLRDILMETIPKLPEEKTKIYQALLQQLRTLAGEQIRSMASLGGHVVSRGSAWDLNPILSAGKSVLNLASDGGKRQILLDDQFLAGHKHADIEPKEVIVSVLIPYSTKDEFISAFRQAERQKNAFSIVNSGLRVLFTPGTDTIVDLSILYGGIGSTTLSARKSCEKLIGRQWNDQMLSEACKLVLEEISLPPSASGGKVEYRRALLVSFLFRFYLEVLHGLHQMYPFRYSELSKDKMSALGVLQSGVPQGVQLYQDVDPEQSPQDPVGRPIMHQSGIKHATGEAVFIDDIRPVDGELSLAVVTSIKAHAKIKSIDISEALQVPGVINVVTAKDVPGKNGSDEEEAFAKDKVICVGQIICAVVAETLTQAKCGAKKVKIVYEDLQPVLTIKDAIKHNSYITEERKLEKGDIEKGFKSADKIVEGELHMGGQEHFYLETNSVLVIPRMEDKEMDVYVSTQHATDVQKLVASALNLQSNKIMCHTKRVGGAFGGKITKPSFFAVIAAVAANKTGRPVRFALERNMDMLITGGRHPFFGKYKVGFMKDGRIIAADFQCYINGGCTKDESELVIEYIVLKVDNAYNIPNLRVRGHACKTNLPSNTAFRGFGFPQAGLFVETCIVAVATKTGLPHEKVREINMYRGVNRTAFKEEFDAENLWKCWKECLDKSDYHSRNAKVEEFNRKNYWKKKGIAIIPMKFSVGFNATYFHQAGALVHIYLDGSVLVTHGGIELGQGIHTKMLQIASRELKIPLSYIHFCETSSTTVPNGKYTAGSVGTEINARAVQDACQILWKRLDPIRRKNPKGKWEDWISEAHKKSISLSATGYFKGYVTNMDWETKKGHAFPYFLYGAACSEVEIDCLTGAHKNIRTDIVMDASFSINPAIDIGQIEGAFIQGVGLYTLEEIYFSPEGEQLTLGPDTYKIPAVCDIPEQFHVYLVPNSCNSIAIYSSKGMGEAGFFLGSSVFFAIRDAVAAARKERGLSLDFTLISPLTSERIRMACDDIFTKMVGFMKDGRIIAADFQCYINGGCTKDESELVIEYIVLKVDNAYNIPNLRVRGHACKTNLPSNTAFRGFGFPQAGLFVETCIVAVATKTGLPHEKVREINMYRGVNRTAFKEEFDAENLWKCWKECLDKSDYHSRNAKVEEFNRKNYWKKKGIAIIPMKFSVGFNATYFHQAGALVHIYLDGSVLVTHGGIELGQGIHTKMLQIASRELKIPLSYIHFCETSSTTVPNGKYTAGSVGTEINARAVQDACQILWKRLDPIRRKNPKGKWEDWISEAHKKSISLSATGYFKGYVTNMDWETKKGHAFPYFLYGAACSEVEIDCLTGAHKNIRTDIVMDASFSINPAIDIGQIEGAFIQGVGLYTLEEIYFSPEGEQLTLGPDTYKIPAVCDIPEQFHVYLVPNSCNSIAIYSSKGMGEAGFFLGSSVFFAIRDAVAAARKERGLSLDFTLISPLTSERIRMACDDIFTKMIPKDKPGTYKPWAIDIS